MEIKGILESNDCMKLKIENAQLKKELEQKNYELEKMKQKEKNLSSVNFNLLQVIIKEFFF